MIFTEGDKENINWDSCAQAVLGFVLMGKLNWEKVKIEKQLDRNSFLFKNKKRGKRTAGFLKKAGPTSHAILLRSRKINGMRCCSNLYCTTFIKISSNSLYCSFHRGEKHDW